MTQQTISTLNPASKSKTTMIDFNCCLNGFEPDWALFNALELRFVADISDDDEEGTCCEPVESEDEAHFISLYGHLKSGGVECIHDFPDGCFDQDAIRTACEALAMQSGFELNSFI